MRHLFDDGRLQPAAGKRIYHLDSYQARADHDSLFRTADRLVDLFGIDVGDAGVDALELRPLDRWHDSVRARRYQQVVVGQVLAVADRKSTRLNSSHHSISY